MRLAHWALLVLLVLPGLAYADPVDDSVRRVGLQLQCPVCEGQNVADSNSGLARDMRALIRTRIDAGVPDQQILDEFVASYGDGILTEPPKRGISLGVWIGPLLGVALGTALLAFILMSWRRRPSEPQQAAPVAVSSEAAAEFRRFRSGLGQ